MITVENSDFNEFLDQECAERAKERFKKKYLEKKKIPVPASRRSGNGPATPSATTRCPPGRIWTQCFMRKSPSGCPRPTICP